MKNLMNVRAECQCRTWQPDDSPLPANNLNIAQSQPFIFIEITMSTTDFQHIHSGIFSLDQILDPDQESSVIHAAIYSSFDKIKYFPDMWQYIIGLISEGAQDMVRDPRNTGIKIIPMCVKLSFDVYKDVLKNVTIEEADNTEPTCSICMERFQAGMDVARTPCNHMYHYNCIDRWVDKKNSCPMCRSKLYDYCRVRI